MVDKDDITVLDRYVAQGSTGGFLQGAWSRIRAELVSPGSASDNTGMDAIALCQELSSFPPGELPTNSYWAELLVKARGVAQQRHA